LAACCSGGDVSRSALAEQQLMMASPPSGYMRPEDYLARQAHVLFIRSTAQAEDMYAHNVKLNVPCSWGIRCQMHVRPTLRERTGGAWLGEGPVTPLHKVKPQRLSGPWSQKFAKDLPQPAGDGWGDVDRASGAVYHRSLQTEKMIVKKAAAPTKPYFQSSQETVLGARRPAETHEKSKREIKQEKEAEAARKKEQSLEAQEAAIKAQISKAADAYGDAAITTGENSSP